MKLDTHSYSPDDYEALYALQQTQVQQAKRIDQVVRGLRKDPPVLPTETPAVIGDWAVSLRGAFNRAFLPAKARRLADESPLMALLRTLRQRAEDRAAGMPACRRCGCTPRAACEGGCHWVNGSGLCSACRLIEIEQERNRLQQELATCADDEAGRVFADIARVCEEAQAILARMGAGHD